VAMPTVKETVDGWRGGAMRKKKSRREEKKT
jgi:hypothetical protein